MVIESNKKLYAYMCEKIVCPCGSQIYRSNVTTHRKCNKHQRWVEEQGGSLTKEDIVKLKALLASRKSYK
jgi:hypothetical protein